MPFSYYRYLLHCLFNSNTLTDVVAAVAVNGSTHTIETFCRILNCQPGDIMEYIEENDSPEV